MFTTRVLKGSCFCGQPAQGIDDEDQTCYDIEDDAADASDEDWANPGSQY